MIININNYIQSKIIIIPQPHSGNNIIIEELEYIDAFFTTVNGGFGGYSYHSTDMFLREIYRKRGEQWSYEHIQCTINSDKFPDLVTITNNFNPPIIQTTTVKWHGWSGAWNLMAQILKYSAQNNYKIIRLTQLIHLLSSQSNLFKNIANSMMDNVALIPTKIIFDIDENYYKKFTDILNNVMSKNIGK